MKSLQPPAWYQVWVLSIRNVQFYLRNPELMLAKLFTYIFMGGFMGASFTLNIFYILWLRAVCQTSKGVRRVEINNKPSEGGGEGGREHAP